MAKESFKYRRRERTADDIRSKASEGSRDFDNLWKGDVKLFKPKDGENILRILPATWGSQPFTNAELDKMSESELRKLEEEDEKFGNGWDVTIYIHYGVGADNGAYLCREKMLGERCPICEAQKASHDPDEADNLKPTKRALVWVIDRDAEKDGPLLWSMPWQKIRNEIYSRSVDKKHGTPIIVDGRPPDYEGFDIIFNKSGKEDRTNYTGVEIDRDASPISDDEKREQKWLDYVTEHPLPDVLNFFDEEHIDKVLRGRTSSRRSSRDDASEEEERGGRTRGLDEGSSRAGRFSRRAAEDDREKDYLSEEEGEAGADVEEERTTTRRRPGRGAAEEPEEEETRAATRGSRRSARGAEREPEPDEEVEEERPTRGGTRRRGQPEPEAEPEDGEGDTPTEQARSGLRSLRSRRAGR